MSVRLAIAVPCHVFIAPQMAQSLARMMHFLGDYAAVEWGIESPRYPVEESYVRFFGNAVSTFGRNELVHWAKSKEATHMLWIDTDSQFPQTAAMQLLESGKPFIGANFALKDGSGQSAAWGLDGERLKPRSEGIEEVSTLGFGLTLTRMDVLEAVGEPWFKTVEGERGGPADEYRFCQLARAAGFPPHVDHALSRECRHVGLHPFALPEE